MHQSRTQLKVAARFCKACWILFLFSLPVASHGEHVINLVVENDLFTGTDRHYTSGVMLNYVSDIDGGPKQLREWGFDMPGISERDRLHVAISIGHEIYTPTDIDAVELLEDERPYAGYAYLAAGFSAANQEEVDTWRVSLGLVGPGAKGEYIQNTVHEFIGEEPANGWQNELSNEWVVNVEYEKKWLNRAWEPPGEWRLEMDAIPYFNAALGNLHSYAGLGGMVRFGQGLRRDIGPPRVRPSLPLTQFSTEDMAGSWYFFAGVEGRWVLHNIFLDGNTFTDSHQIDKRPFVGDLQAGFVWNHRDFKLGYTYIIRTKEFEGQDDHDVYGSLSFSLHF